MLSVAFTVPASYAGSGALSWAEYGGSPTYRTVTLSTSACDFRAFDPTGVNGPLWKGASGIGTVPLAGLKVGHTYYVNIVNEYLPTSYYTCGTANPCNLILLWQ